MKGAKPHRTMPSWAAAFFGRTARGVSVRSYGGRLRIDQLEKSRFRTVHQKEGGRNPRAPCLKLVPTKALTLLPSWVMAAAPRGTRSDVVAFDLALEATGLSRDWGCRGWPASGGGTMKSDRDQVEQDATAQGLAGRCSPETLRRWIPCV